MKRVLLFLVLLALSILPVASQTVYWSESFNSNNGWTLQQNWSIAGGKMEFYWSPTVTNFDLSATSPTIALHPNTQSLIVNQHLDVYGSSNPPEVAQIYLATAVSQVLLWSHTLNTGNWGNPTGSELQFDISQYAGQNVSLKFRTYGLTTFNWDWWHIFDVKLTAIFQNDLAAIGITGPNSLNPSQQGTYSVQVKNTGNQPQQGFTVSLYSKRFEELLGTINVAQPILPQQIATYNFTWTPAFVHNTVLYAEVILTGDEFNGNNTSGSLFVRIKPTINPSILVWDNDNGISTVVCPDQGDLIQPTTALTRTLDKAGLTYQLVSVLPQNLSGYDIVFASLGCYCLS